MLSCYCVLSQAGQCAIKDAVWTEILHQLIVACVNLRDKVLGSCVLVISHFQSPYLAVQMARIF